MIGRAQPELYIPYICWKWSCKNCLLWMSVIMLLKASHLKQAEWEYIRTKCSSGLYLSGYIWDSSLCYSVMAPVWQGLKIYLQVLWLPAVLWLTVLGHIMIAPCCAEIILGNMASPIIPQHWDGTGYWNPPSWTTRIQLLCVVLHH